MIVRDRPGALTLMFVVRGTILTAVYPQLLILLLFALLIQAVHEWQWLVIPEFSSSPFALLGVAMSIFLGFRNNAAYERWWEGRMQWGRIIDQVRSIARSSETLLADHPARRQLLALVAGHFHALRGRLRKEDVHADLQRWLGDDLAEQAISHGNAADYCLREAGRLLGSLYRDGALDTVGVQMLDRQLAELAKVQAACERLASTRMPFAYTVLTHRVAYLYCYLLPFGLVGPLGWLAPVFTVLLGYTFFGLDALSEQLEEPFGREANDLPLEALCRVNEISIAESFGDAVPDELQPDHFILH
ncbi:MAG: hypothetical protein CMI08_07150 [Oceanospirillaceae bacterium]|uniref:bestrophin family protein n=1 Tax=unclassified Thalassolituus TaxID=2624967 RepID=UPI000C4D501A|nr:MULTISPECIES: bestrophin family ion channel [unclassified Thalassolituus]MAS24421.1 hypothetical protein [Oceanospirillaceae bacterium]MAX98968.1 hypothetical protein [Oceanospirillaceae bacterium]MBL35369.1 hypothetical protein [Oceanospirillaceae bacterium]MBS54860.1 hypothetical protein [Oceanospirillaceae bacterium]|tara:strand:+ start:611 stop:1519 length:909 start_codon:yes stop_codon:yes gene_type:complete